MKKIDLGQAAQLIAIFGVIKLEQTRLRTKFLFTRDLALIGWS